MEGHPINIVSGGDIVRILKEKGTSSEQALTLWLNRLEEKLA